MHDWYVIAAYLISFILISGEVFFVSFKYMKNKKILEHLRKNNEKKT